MKTFTLLASQIEENWLTWIKLHHVQLSWPSIGDLIMQHFWLAITADVWISIFKANWFFMRLLVFCYWFRWNESETTLYAMLILSFEPLHLWHWLFDISSRYFLLSNFGFGFGWNKFDVWLKRIWIGPRWIRFWNGWIFDFGLNDFKFISNVFGFSSKPLWFWPEWIWIWYET